MNIIKNKIFKDTIMGYLDCFLSIIGVLVIISFFVDFPVATGQSAYSIFIKSMPGVILIASIAIGCISIQYIRLFMLSGATRKIAFQKVLVINLLAIIPPIALYSIALLLPFNTLGFTSHLLYFIVGIAIGLGFGFYASSITTICHVYLSIPVIAISAFLVFIVPIILSDTKSFDITLPIIIIALCLIPISYFIYTRKISRIKSTSIN